MSSNTARAAIAEAIGTFALVFIGVLAISSATAAGSPGAATLATIGLAHGLTIAVMVAALGAVSGGHFNPAVTFGFLVTRRFKLSIATIYWLAQLGGATLAALLVASLVGPVSIAGGTPDLAVGLTPVAGAIAEAVATFFLVLVVFGTAVDPRAPKYLYPFAIGLTISLGIFAIGPLTGGALNPARAFGPALVSGHWSNQLLYWIGPLLGGGIAALVEDRLLLAKEPAAEEEPSAGVEREEEAQAA